MTSPPSRKKQKNAFCFRFGPCLCVVYSLEEESQTRTNERERERERVRENSARSAPLLKRLKRRGKSCFLSLFLSSSLALTQTTFAPKKRFDLSSSSSLFPPGSSSLVHVVFFPSLSFSRLVSRVKLDEIARFEIYIYIYTRARDQREVRRMNTPFRRKKNEEAQKEEKKRCLRMQLQRARSL